MQRNYTWRAIGILLLAISAGDLQAQGDEAQPKSEMKITGPVRFEFSDTLDTFMIRGRKEDVDEIMKLIASLSEKKAKEQTDESPKLEADELENESSPDSTLIEGPVRIEFIEGTDIFMTRGKKEDVERVMKVIQRIEEHQANSKTDEDTKLQQSDASDVESMKPRISAALDEATEFKFEKTPLRDVIAYFAKRHELPIRLDELALKAAKTKPESPVTIENSNISLRSALRLSIDAFGLTYVVQDNGLLITTKAKAEAILNRKPNVSYFHEIKHVPAWQIAASVNEMFVDLMEGDVRAVSAPGKTPGSKGLAISAPSSLHKRIAAFVKKLDQPPAETRIYSLKNASVSQVAQMLKGLFGKNTSATFAGDKATNTLIVKASKKDQQKVSMLIAQVDEQAVEKALSRAKASLAGVIWDVERKKVIADRVTPGSDAAIAGMKSGDQLCKVNNELVTVENFTELLRAKEDRLDLVLRRGDVEMTFRFPGETALHRRSKKMNRDIAEQMAQGAQQLQKAVANGDSARIDRVVRIIFELNEQRKALLGRGDLMFPTDVERAMIGDGINGGPLPNVEVNPTDNSLPGKATEFIELEETTEPLLEDAPK